MNTITIMLLLLFMLMMGQLIHVDARISATVIRGCRCGVTSVADQRVVGGENSRKHQWPWIVAILYIGQQHCGGTLINDRHVITAAHCLYRFQMSKFTIALMDHDLSTNTETNHITATIGSWDIHEKFNPDYFKNDIAIIELSKVLDLTDEGMPVPICLPYYKVTKSYTKTPAVVAGWGATSSNSGKASDTLKHVSVLTMGNKKCIEHSAYDKGIIEDNMICARDRGKDGCFGDSGGPLVVRRTKNTKVYDLIGIVSFAIGCAEWEYPGVYTRITSFRKWIADRTIDCKWCRDSLRFKGRKKRKKRKRKKVVPRVMVNEEPEDHKTDKVTTEVWNRKQLFSFQGRNGQNLSKESLPKDTLQENEYPKVNENQEKQQNKEKGSFKHINRNNEIPPHSSFNGKFRAAND